MKVLVIVKATKNSEAGAMPSTEMLAQMGRFNDELVQAGVMLAGEGLRASSAGVRVRFSGSERSVVKGPFPEPTSLVAGFWIWQVKSMDEALAWAQRCPHPSPGEEGELELRPIAELEDFGAALTPELREQEARQRRQAPAAAR